MPEFKYKALNKDNKVIKGEITATNEVLLSNILEEMELELVQYSHKTNFSIEIVSSKITAKDLIILCIHMKEYEKAGVPLLESLNELHESSENMKLKKIMLKVYEDVKNGSMLSFALAQHKQVFDNLFVNLIAAGEETGNLAEIWESLAIHIKWNMKIKKMLLKAIMYPVSMLIMQMIMVTIMMLFVVPEIVKFLESQNIELPMQTVMLIALSNFFGKYWVGIVSFIPAIYFISATMNRTSKKFRYFIAKLTLNIPIIGRILIKIDVARFCRFFAITYDAGIEILRCLEISSGVISNIYLSSKLETVYTKVEEGSSLNEALESTGYFPSIIIRLFGIGEESGNIGEVLHNVNSIYEQEISDSIELLISTVKPTMIIIVGIIIAWIVLAVFGPIYGSFGQM